MSAWPLDKHDKQAGENGGNLTIVARQINGLENFHFCSNGGNGIDGTNGVGGTYSITSQKFTSNAKAAEDMHEMEAMFDQQQKEFDEVDSFINTCNRYNHPEKATKMVQIQHVDDIDENNVQRPSDSGTSSGASFTNPMQHYGNFYLSQKHNPIRYVEDDGYQPKQPPRPMLSFREDLIDYQRRESSLGSSLEIQNQYENISSPRHVLQYMTYNTDSTSQYEAQNPPSDGAPPVFSQPIRGVRERPCSSNKPSVCPMYLNNLLAIEQISPIQLPRSVEHRPEGITDAVFVYTEQDQAPPSVFSTSATYLKKSEPTYNNYSLTNSYYSGSEASHTVYSFDMEGMPLNSTPQPTQVNTSNVQNIQKKRGRPQEPSTKGPDQEIKNKYMRSYNQIKKEKLETLYELVNLYDQLFENLHDQLICCPKNEPIYQKILKLKNDLKDLEEQLKNRGKSKQSDS